MARRRKSSLRKTLHDMHPKRVLWRGMSGPEVVSGLRSLFRPTTKTTPAARKKAVAAMQRKAAAPAKKAAAKKPARSAQPATAKKTVAVRKKNGQFDGRKAMSPRELAAFERAEQGYVDPALRIRNSRTRRG
jgi:hypothetical protein